MSTTLDDFEDTETVLVPRVLRLRPAIDLSDDQLFELCRINDELRIERNERGDLIMMSPAGGESSHRNIQIARQLADWAERDGTGIAFDSSGGFRLRKRAMRSPDAAWIRLTRWNRLPAEEREKFAPICPDFVIELRSRTDRLAILKKKMREYIDNGARMGLLIDPYQRMVYVYRPSRDVEVLDDPKSVSCGPVLRGFMLDMEMVW
jgi:Uma2 family endonuclease